jgi:hypothetical protein
MSRAVNRALSLTATIIVAFVALIITAHGASAIPLPAITRLVSSNGVGDAHSQTNVLGPAEASSSGTSVSFDPPATIVGSGHAVTSGFFSTFVIAPNLLSNLGQAHVEARVDNVGSVGVPAVNTAADFRYFVEIIGPSRTSVPLNVGWHVQSSNDVASAPTFASILIAQPTSADINAGQIIKFSEQADHADRSGVATIDVRMDGTLATQLSIELRASCSTGTGALVTSNFCSATADPTFSLPAEFAEQYRLDFSPNLAPALTPPAPAAVPEPATAALLLTGSLAVGASKVAARVRRRIGVLRS